MGGLCRQCLFFVVDWRIFKKKKKTGDDLYKSLIILLYSWLHTREKKKIWQNFTTLSSLVTIESIWKHLNLEFLTYNFVFRWNFARENKGHPHYALVKCLMSTNLFMSSNHMQHRPSFFSYHLISLGCLVHHFPFDFVSWDCCYKISPRQTQKLNPKKLVAQWWESVYKRMLEINVAHEVVVSSRKKECRGKACQERKSREEIIASSRKRYISLT